MKNATPEEIDNFLLCLKSYIQIDPAESDGDLLLSVLDIVHAISETSRDTGKPIMVIARGG